MTELDRDIHVFPSALSAGTAIGEAIEKCIVKLQKNKKTIRMIFAAAPSQNYMLEYLTKSTSINWSQIEAFHMDEYLGLPAQAPQLFSSYLEERLFSKVNFKASHKIDSHKEISEEIAHYSNLITAHPIDIVCLGIGENGHIAFNDPPVADFDDPVVMKEVVLDEACRMQQVHDGCFGSIDEVPKTALTLTIPTLLDAENLFCIVLGKNKSEAVRDTLKGSISTDCPASILTRHPNCQFYFDEEAFGEVTDI
ncbi:glucosamine-6-phosphate deaminase [Marinoscillum furvescens]|uniref:Glucosamine-6-phosphate deaminase n=1 Tax=Marinoscillum furvescens DSM 4134 TaxID=1122208 RepID=A0A3D9LJ86_MARFU|nr:glucosamine-6-phosphate deaminase [Marinoscillum furvescens]REE05873.1 glucosamine-6-phosphate deaminase [Marinoscillum furvescens DSM 4134]